MSRVPEGPWLLVLGMHRSGTSAVTGVLRSLGFATSDPSDRVDWPESNLEHWESAALTAFDDRLLARLGGSWEAAPELEDGWEHHELAARAGEGAATLASVYSAAGPLLWKDPRLCLLLPFWRAVLPGPIAAVLVWRSPLGVARSLESRDGMPAASGVALWERYNRTALDVLDGIDTYVCRYETFVDGPEASVDALAGWLGTLPQFAGAAAGWDRAAATASLKAPAAGRDAGSDRLLLAEQRALAEQLAELEGGHRPLEAPALPPESAWTTALLAARRGSRSRELDELEALLEARRVELEHLRGSTSWRVTKPLRAATARLRPDAR